MKRRIATLLAPTLLVLMVSAFAQPAQAAVAVGYYVVNKTVLNTNYVRYAQEIGSCSALTSGITCTISRTSSATRTIGLDLGVSRGIVASGLSISSATSQSVSVSCTSPAMSAGQTFRAYPVGTYYQYKVQKKVFSTGVPTTTTTSPYLYAFNPRTNGFACAVR